MNSGTARTATEVWKRQRGWLWIGIGVAAVCAVMLIDLGRLLGDIQAPGRPSYDAAIFTQPQFNFWNTEQLSDAIELWECFQRKDPKCGKFDVQSLLSWHVLTDAFLFTPAYCLLLWALLKRFTPRSGFAGTMAFLIFVVDELENWATFHFVRGLMHESTNGLRLVQGLTALKWMLLIAAGVALLGLWWKRRRTLADYELRAEGENPGRPLSGLIVLVLLFAALIALPAGGPLEQLPDVLRSHVLNIAESPALIMSLLAFFLFGSAVAAAGFAAVVDRVESSAASQTPITSVRVVAVAVVISTLLTAGVWISDGRFSWVPWSFTWVALGVSIAAVLVRKAELEASTVSDARLALVSGERARQWVGALAGAVVVIGGLGLVRAAFPPMVVRLPDPPVAWRLIALIGIVISIFGGFFFQWLVARVGGRAMDRPWYRYPPTLAITIISVVLAASLAVRPHQGELWGTTGVVPIGFAFLAVLIGLIKWASRRLPPWSATQSLGFGNHTPWLTLLWTTWIVASLSNTAGIYHDARVVPADGVMRGAIAPTHADLQTAFKKWIAAQNEDCARDPGRALPMVFVAAPGGGIRAAYWTTQTLEVLFGANREDCAARRLFAISSASGGSVGATTWLASLAAGKIPSVEIAAMSEDHALASAMAGTLLRDLAQPLIGIATRWRDRAALLEDGWEASASPNVFTTGSRSLRWSELGRTLPWMPVLVLNSSSVNDGCRVLIANVGGLPTAATEDCARHSRGAQLGGPVSSAIDPFPALVARKNARNVCSREGAEKNRGTDMEALTAALLSARFPYVSPSGALLQCKPSGSADAKDNYSVTYAVDGGYYENSGLLTLLQIWGAIEPWVREYNRTHGEVAPIAPWIVVADNAYHSPALANAAGRPLEVLAPLRARGKDNVLVEKEPLEQMAATAIRSPPKIQCAPECSEAPPPSSRPPAVNNCLVVISPNRQPSVAAPLGWILSKASRGDLNTQLNSRLGSADPGTRELLEQLGKAPATPDERPESCVWGGGA